VKWQSTHNKAVLFHVSKSRVLPNIKEKKRSIATDIVFCMCRLKKRSASTRCMSMMHRDKNKLLFSLLQSVSVCVARFIHYFRQRGPSSRNFRSIYKPRSGKIWILLVLRIHDPLVNWYKLFHSAISPKKIWSKSIVCFILLCQFPDSFPIPYIFIYHMYTCIYVYMYICVYIYINIHTYIHIHIYEGMLEMCHATAATVVCTYIYHIIIYPIYVCVYM